ncbi:hypothetical protein J4E93_002128 [Alternaria ventricosa]|uniref:uncharacterized protein n=1 Tax=Alternaria ventricosa TaxID=1187951 RepID=UPI0020C31796|nr:uncharacterized protein J4E93_002128 [Alternaria ventricosa]KAI4651932.1 hypothetical protein J4E93_002128 [Alternaria ventricosa]
MMRFLVFLSTSLFAIFVASRDSPNNPSTQPLRGSDIIISPRDADIDRTCRRLRTLTKLNKIAHNETLMDSMIMRDKFAQQRIDWIKNNSDDITAKLEALASNSTLTAECDTINAQHDTARECKALQTLERLVNSTNGHTDFNGRPAADFLSDEQKQKSQQKFEKAELKLQQLRSNVTLLGLCNNDFMSQQGGVIGNQVVDNSGAISMTRSVASSHMRQLGDASSLMALTILMTVLML